MKLYTLLAVGTDAEVFLTRGSLPYPAIGLLGGTKLEPKPIPGLGKGFAIQEDNVMPEFNIPASKNKKIFSDNIGTVLEWLTSGMAEKGFDVLIAPSCHFNPKQLKHPQAQEIGCEPDFNAWTRTINPSPKTNPILKTMRTAAAHVHVSFNINGEPPKTIYDREPLVKALDVTLGLPSLLLDKDIDRRKLYGKAGAFRPKDYGIEHRVMSNFWIKTPELRAWVWDGVVAAFSLLNKDECTYFRKFLKNYSGHIQGAIDNCSQSMAQEMLQICGLAERMVVEHESA